MTRTPRQSTFTTETGDGYRLEFTVKGFVDTDAETYLSEILALAAHVFNDVYSANFEDEVVDMLDHKFRARLENEAKPSEFDLGWAAGRQAALLETEQSDALETLSTMLPDEGMVGKILEVTSPEGAHGFPIGTKVTIVRDDQGDNPLAQYLATTREDSLDDPDAWTDEWQMGVTAYVGPANTKKTWVDSPSEG